jgi:nucleotide-binding universal stress UspA family protein
MRGLRRSYTNVGQTGSTPVVVEIPQSGYVETGEQAVERTLNEMEAYLGTLASQLTDAASIHIEAHLHDSAAEAIILQAAEDTPDVIVMATGFQPADYLARMKVVGRTGRTLQEYWADEPHAFLGITVPEFPNFFILYGPGTNGGEIVSLLQRQSEYAVRCMKRMTREGVTAIEVKKPWADIYHAWLQSTPAALALLRSWLVSTESSPSRRTVLVVNCMVAVAKNPGGRDEKYMLKISTAGVRR